MTLAHRLGNLIVGVLAAIVSLAALAVVLVLVVPLLVLALAYALAMLARRWIMRALGLAPGRPGTTGGQDPGRKNVRVIDPSRGP